MLVSMEEGSREAEEMSHGRYRCWPMARGGEIPPAISPAVSAPAVSSGGLVQIGFATSASSVLSLRGAGPQLGIHCAVSCLVGFSDIQEHRMLGLLSFK